MNVAGDTQLRRIWEIVMISIRGSSLGFTCALEGSASSPPPIDLGALAERGGISDMQPFRPDNQQQQQQQLQQQILQQQQVMRGQQQHQELVKRRQRQRRAKREFAQPSASTGNSARLPYRAPPMPDASLAVIAGPAAGTTFHVRDQLRLGRAETAEGSLGGDATLSRHHAVLHRATAGELLVEDLGSTNGTWINGERITGQRRLFAGDQVHLGETTLVVPGPAKVSGVSRHDTRPAESWLARSRLRTARTAVWLGGCGVLLWVLVVASHAEWVRLHDGPIHPVSYGLAVLITVIIITVIIVVIIAAVYQQQAARQQIQYGDANAGPSSTGAGQSASTPLWQPDPAMPAAGGSWPAADSPGAPAVRYDSQLADGTLQFYAPEDPGDGSRDPQT